MTDIIITSDLSKVALSTRMVIFGKGKAKIDISKMFQGGDAYIEVTTISKEYGKKFYHWIANKDTKEYIATLENILYSRNSVSLDKPHKIGISENHSQSVGLDNTNSKTKSPLIIRKAGRYGGTYLHKKLALKYFRWLDMDFEIEIDMFLEKVYKTVNAVKVHRADSKAKFHPLTEVIKEIYIPAQTDEMRIKFAYQEIMNLVNIRVLGMKAHEFRALHDIPSKTSIYTRDYIGDKGLERIVTFQQYLHGFICAGITDIDMLESMISKIPLL